MEKATDIEIGKRYQDKVTGFQGVAQGICEHLNGTVQVDITPGVDSEGKIKDGWWIDFQKLELLESESINPPESGPKTHIELGSVVEDRVTGFQGIATQRHKHFAGCITYHVEARAKNNELKSEWIDSERLRVVAAATDETKPTKTGCSNIRSTSYQRS